MFERTREIRKQARLKRKETDAISERRLEKTIGLELQNLLEKYLENNDCVEVEIDVEHIAIFLRVCENLSEYRWERVSETLFRFEAKEFVW